MFAQIVEYRLDEAYAAVVMVPSQALGLQKLLSALAEDPGRWGKWTAGLRERPVNLKARERPTPPAFRTRSRPACSAAGGPRAGIAFARARALTLPAPSSCTPRFLPYIPRE